MEMLAAKRWAEYWLAIRKKLQNSVTEPILARTNIVEIQAPFIDVFGWS